MPPLRDFGHLTDRELLVAVYKDLQEIKEWQVKADNRIVLLEGFRNYLLGAAAGVSFLVVLLWHGIAAAYTFVSHNLPPSGGTK